MKEKIKKYKWKERLICLGIAYEIFLVTYMITQIIDSPSSTVIHWATREMLISLMAYTFLVLIFNWKIVAIGFPIGHIVGLIVGDFFGVDYMDIHNQASSTHAGIYIQASLITTLVAIGLEIAYRVRRRAKAKLSNATMSVN